MRRLGRRAEMAREFADLQAGLVELRERLASEQQSTASLQYRLHELERRNHELSIRVSRDHHTLARDSAPAGSSRPGFGPANGSAAIDGWPSDTASGNGGSAASYLSGHGHALTAPPLPPLSMDRLAVVAESASDTSERNEWAIEELRSSMERISGRIDELKFAMQTQLQDLGFEIERAAASSRATAAVSDLALDRQLDHVREAQVRLAGEQARYEIALRSELADMADALRRYT